MIEKVKKILVWLLEIIKKIDNFLLAKRVYRLIIVGVLVFLFIVFRYSFASDKVFKNYTPEDDKTIQVSRSTKYQMSFEAKEKELNYIRIYFDPSKSELSSKDKLKVTLSDEQNYLLYTHDVYLYNSDSGYIRIDMDNVNLDPNEWYYLKLDFSEMEKTSHITLKAHQTFLMNPSRIMDSDSGEEIALDYSIGFNKVPNISYYFNKANYFSMIVQILFFVGICVILFVDKLWKKRKFKEGIRAALIPIFLYLLAEILNVEKLRPLQIFAPLTMKYWFCFILTLVVIELFYYFLYAVIGSGTISALITGLIVAVLGFVNHTKLVMRGDSFMPWDIVSAGIAVKTGSTYYFHVTINFIAGILICLMYLCFVRITRTRFMRFTRTRIYQMLASAFAMLFVFSGFILNTKMLDTMKIYYQVNPPIQSYNENGTVLAFLMHLNNIKANGGENNSPENVKDLIYQYEGISASNHTDNEVNKLEVKPNVICIMSEAFSDPRTIRDFQTSEPIMPYYDQLMQESINGRTAVSIFGGGTCNTEFEFLTGYSVANLLPGSSVYTFYVNNEIEALPHIYRENGYRTVALHSFDGDWWDRREKYPLLGFDEFYTRDDFDSSARYVRRYISDYSTFEKITDIYEESEEPLFMFCVTMQNHADFSARYDNMNYDITIDDMHNEDGSNYYYAENYISLLRESDDALEYLVEYFRNVDEPTIIVMFGDHYPTLDQGFYDALLQTDLGGISVEESLPIYETPYFIWANFDLSQGGTTLDTTFGNHGITSPNFLGQTILDLSGVESPESRACLRVLRHHISAVNALTVYDLEGLPHFDDNELDEETRTILNDYATIQYGLVYYDETSVGSSVE
ncbi:MAG: sulfatase-like hydrolase/transferase [Saccharofermentans sp.]|nr:sulfatase-like hydrolase/transferase [Saccharofermentans sp.]